MAFEPSPSPAKTRFPQIPAPPGLELCTDEVRDINRVGVAAVVVVVVVGVVVVVVVVVSTPAQLCPNSGTHFCLTSSA